MAELELKMNAAGVDPNLIAWLQAAARNSPYRVVAYSGMREGDPRFHGKGKAIDINLIDPVTGKTIPNYQNAASFQTYQNFANQVRAAQMQMNPERANAFRWGGYFSGQKGKYGAMDLMHFDVGGDTTPMGGGGWEQGLTPAQAALWKLGPGGGVSGGGAAGTAPAAPSLGDTMADATKPDPFQKLVSNFASDVGGAGLGQSGGGGGSLGGTGTEAQQATLETPEARPPTDALETNPGTLSPPGQNLADIFQVKPIGGASVQSPYLPPKRKWV